MYIAYIHLKTTPFNVYNLKTSAKTMFFNVHNLHTFENDALLMYIT